VAWGWYTEVHELYRKILIIFRKKGTEGGTVGITREERDEELGENEQRDGGESR
jgi:hypothetical protein